MGGGGCPNTHRLSLPPALGRPPHYYLAMTCCLTAEQGSQSRCRKGRFRLSDSHSELCHPDSPTSFYFIRKWHQETFETKDGCIRHFCPILHRGTVSVCARASLCVHLIVWLSMFVCVYACTHAHVCMCRPENNLNCHFSNVFHIPSRVVVRMETVSHWLGIFQVGWQKNLTYLHVSPSQCSTGIIGMCNHA